MRTIPSSWINKYDLGNEAGLVTAPDGSACINRCVCVCVVVVEMQSIGVLKARLWATTGLTLVLRGAEQMYDKLFSLCLHALN